MYNAKELNKPQGGTGVKIPVGIHEGITFSGVVKESTWIDINFHNNDGRSIYKRLFNPSGSKPKENETVSDALQREQERNARILSEVMYAVMDAEIVDAFTAPTYQAFVDGALFYLQQKKGALVNLKVVPDYKEKKYPDLPLSSFVEKHVPGTPTTFTFSKGQQGDIAKMLAQREDTPASDDSDLPF